MNNYCVYKHTSPSGKVYIGITGQSPVKRWGGGTGYFNNPYFTSAIKKYGWKNIKHEIVIDGLSREEAALKEKKLIKEFKSCDPQYGYNLTYGGDFGVKQTESVRNKISCALKKYNADPEAREKKRRKYPNRKRRNPLSEESKKKIGKTKREKGIGNGITPRHVLCVETGEIYESVKDVCDRFGYTQSMIYKSCHLENFKAYGFTWQYANSN